MWPLKIVGTINTYIWNVEIVIISICTEYIYRNASNSNKSTPLNDSTQPPDDHFFRLWCGCIISGLDGYVITGLLHKEEGQKGQKEQWHLKNISRCDWNWKKLAKDSNESWFLMCVCVCLYCPSTRIGSESGGMLWIDGSKNLLWDEFQKNATLELPSLPTEIHDIHKYPIWT